MHADYHVAYSCSHARNIVAPLGGVRVFIARIEDASMLILECYRTMTIGPIDTHAQCRKVGCLVSIVVSCRNALICTSDYNFKGFIHTVNRGQYIIL